MWSQKRCAVIHSTPRLFLSMRQTNTIHTPSSRCAASSSTAKRGCHCHESTGLRSVVQAWWAGGYASSSGYTLSQPGVQCCDVIAETVAQLEQNVSMARAFQPLSAQEIAAIRHSLPQFGRTVRFSRAWRNRSLSLRLLPLPQCLSQPGRPSRSPVLRFFPISSRFIPQFFTFDINFRLKMGY